MTKGNSRVLWQDTVLAATPQGNVIAAIQIVRLPKNADGLLHVDILAHLASYAVITDASAWCDAAIRRYREETGYKPPIFVENFLVDWPEPTTRETYPKWRGWDKSREN